MCDRSVTSVRCNVFLSFFHSLFPFLYVGCGRCSRSVPSRLYRFKCIIQCLVFYRIYAHSIQSSSVVKRFVLIFSSFKFQRLPFAVESRIQIDLFSSRCFFQFFFFSSYLCLYMKCSDLGSRCLRKHKVCINIDFEDSQNGRERERGIERCRRITMAVVPCRTQWSRRKIYSSF